VNVIDKYLKKKVRLEKAWKCGENRTKIRFTAATQAGFLTIFPAHLNTAGCVNFIEKYFNKNLGYKTRGSTGRIVQK
jgi:hypothetical protein